MLSICEWWHMSGNLLHSKEEDLYTFINGKRYILFMANFIDILAFSITMETKLLPCLWRIIYIRLIQMGRPSLNASSVITWAELLGWMMRKTHPRISIHCSLLLHGRGKMTACLKLLPREAACLNGQYSQNASQKQPSFL